MKVLHLGAGNLYGGIETFFVTMARLRHLCPEMEPEFGLCFRSRLWDELIATGVRVHDLGAVRFSRPWTVWRARRRLAKVLAEAKPDVVVAHGSWPHALAAPRIRSAGVRFLHFAHGPMGGRNWVERWAARTPPDRVITNSHYMMELMTPLFPGVPATVWYYPIVHEQTPANSDVRRELGTLYETVVILQASRLERWKGHSVLIAALARLKQAAGWECWIAGGVQKQDEAGFLIELREAVTRAGIADRVRFLGQRSDVPQLMAAADIYCQPNTGPEPFGIAFVEALRARLPVVTSAFGGGAEIVTSSCGVLTPPGDAEAVAGALSNLIGLGDRRRTLGAAGPKRAEELCDPARQLAAFAEAVGFR